MTVDGALHPHVVLGEVDLVGCPTFLNQLELPDDVEDALHRRQELEAEAAAQQAVHLIDAGDEKWTRDRINLARSGGTKMATITNYFDRCLSINATLSNAAPQKICSWTTGSTGIDKHSALLKAHGAGTVDPGYPLPRSWTAPTTSTRRPGDAGGTAAGARTGATGRRQPERAHDRAGRRPGDGSARLGRRPGRGRRGRRLDLHQRRL